ncbi:MAG: TRAP transporter substrate-binding protein DctP [Woeseia sp.]
MNLLRKAAPAAGSLLMMLVLVAACDRDELRGDIRLSHPFTENDPRHKWAMFVAERMAERTGGEVAIRIFPNQQLFKGRQQYEGLRTNRIDLAIYPMPWLSGRVPAANIGALPGVIGSLEEGLAWRERRVWDLLAESVERADVHMASILWVPATYAGRESVPRLPNNLSGISMRGMGAPLETLLAANGASISSMPAADTYFGLQTGSLDVLFSTVSSFLGYSMQEVVREIVVGRSFLAGGHFVLMSRGLRQ